MRPAPVGTGQHQHQQASARSRSSRLLNSLLLVVFFVVDPHGNGGIKTEPDEREHGYESKGRAVARIKEDNDDDDSGTTTSSNNNGGAEREKGRGSIVELERELEPVPRGGRARRVVRNGNAARQKEQFQAEAEQLQREKEELELAVEQTRREFESKAQALDREREEGPTTRKQEKRKQELRQKTAQKLAEFDQLKTSLQRDLQNRCETVIWRCCSTRPARAEACSATWS